MPYVLTFIEQGSVDPACVGGKGANLGRLTSAGFLVPEGFTVTTDAHTELNKRGGLGGKIADICATLDYGNPDQLEAQTTRIRELIVGTELPPEISQAVRAAYRSLGEQRYVAVRSSGTAEDLAEASFAGLHDTYLDIRGEAEVEKAIRACWASMWTARATAYRHKNGFDHDSARLAVVVQIMVEAEVAGVMFTGNPLSTATDELLINASWGLGESVVGGTVTPDQYIVQAETMRVLDKTLGSKASRIVRDREGSHGTVTLDTAPAMREKYCLDDAGVADLARLGIRVQDYYGGFPQDIEWALSDGRFYLLQSRPITGVEFSWDAELDEVDINPKNDPDWVWTRSFSDSVMTGGMTPLNYSARFTYGMNRCWNHMAQATGVTELVGMRLWKYYKGEMYYNCHWERIWLERMALPAQRKPGSMLWVPKSWHDDIAKSPFSLLNYLKSLVGTQLFDKQIFGFKKMMADWRANRVDEVRGLTPDQLRKLTDRELKVYIKHQLEVEVEYGAPVVAALGEQFAALMSLFADLLAKWYDGGDPLMAFTNLVSGSRERTDTQIENHALWELAQMIRNSAELTTLFRQHQGAAFFTACEQSPAGRAFLDKYKPFATQYEHRGHADRDIIHDRRGDDPGIDYPSFQALLSVKNPVDPEEMERQVNERREATLDEVIANVKRKSFGFVRAEVIKFLYYRIHDYLVLRDNERQFPNDMIIMSWKRGFIEVGKRLHERGHIDSPRDVYFLGWPEAYELLDGHTKNLAFIKTKLAARRRDVDRRMHGEARLPKYLRRYRAVDMDASGPAAASADGAYIGTPTSSGNVTGRARVIRKLSEIGRVEEGDILVTNSTDPGWTPVFLVIKGVVVETGGALSHASCLAREYGFPAVQLEEATRLIPDGATVSVDGNTGAVKVLEEAAA